MFSTRVFSAAIFNAALLFSSIAAVSAAESISAESKKLSQRLNQLIGLDVQSITPTPVDNIIEVTTDQGIFYASADGKFLIQGKLYGIGDNVINYTERSLAKLRMTGLSEFEKEMIVYPAKDEKHVVTIFTDITCGYCRQLHQQMSDYNDLGITIRYLPYPRSGVVDRYGNLTQGFKDLRSIWCHEKPANALTKAKAGSSVAQRICDKPLEEEFEFARQVGVNATPAIVFDNGMMIPGYKTPSSLIEILESMPTDG
ncbi:bifunctional protein-disulfide isomerase/oxidoreductase DsbC [Thalassotalea hakodatensis]|uniref:bifunctional protein-disulfide isomerase/oxidoreductase DsbC n=1 Tax=Thalassotalea hakodatensis TaxID=3030492 RepID=UPI0025724C81|nr:bifunctional protein-disulfide isomerase/oxidoreductase DsbC [Thalassotalea hakodatensis]